MTAEMAEEIALRHMERNAPHMSRIIGSKLFTDKELVMVPQRIRDKLPRPPYWTVAVCMAETPNYVDSLGPSVVYISDTTGDVIPV